MFVWLTRVKFKSSCLTWEKLTRKFQRSLGQSNKIRRRSICEGTVQEDGGECRKISLLNLCLPPTEVYGSDGLDGKRNADADTGV